MSWGFSYRPYVSAATRRAQAAKAAQKAVKSGAGFQPVAIAGRTIARTFWGQAWCRHLESFSDFENRLPRGRTYVRNGSVIHLEISKGCIEAKVMGSSLYLGKVSVRPLAPERWAAIKAECAGKIDSLVGLLQGKLSDSVMRIITDRDKGLFPQPAEIQKSCSCPDWADLCKHLAAVLYGVGARLDTQPELLFLLRGVDHLELIEGAASAPALAGGGEGSLAADQLADVFGIDIEPAGAAPEVEKKTPAKKPRIVKTNTEIVKRAAKKAPKKIVKKKAAPPRKRRGKAI